MYDATENIPTTDEVIAAVINLRDQRDELLDRLSDVDYALHLQRQECERVRRELEEARADMLVIREMTLPGGRSWAFVEDAQVLAVSPDLDEVKRDRLMAQVAARKLTTCPVCGAPVYEGQDCGLCQWDALPAGPAV